ncbi:MAG: lysoplasmalogenase [Myxococcota bacterium]
MLAPTLLTLVALILLLSGEIRAHAPTIRIAKPLASTGFVLAGLAAGGLHSGYGQAIMVALALGWVGDVCLLSRRTVWFTLGLLAFLLAHVALGTAFVMRDPALGWVLGSAVPLLVIALTVRHRLMPYVPSGLRRPVDAYVLVISTMVALAVGAAAGGATMLIPVGAIAFYLSDLSVAQDRFVEPTLRTRLWGLPLYYAAQLVLAASIAATSIAR